MQNYIPNKILEFKEANQLLTFDIAIVNITYPNYEFDGREVKFSVDIVVSTPYLVLLDNVRLIQCLIQMDKVGCESF